jgi:uncharacterized protein YbjT (DUF2867 family)
VARVLVTGGTGFVAGWCIDQLLDAGHEVVTTVRAPARASEVAHPAGSVTVAVGDLSDDSGWDQAMAGCEFVLNVASPMSSDGADAESFVELAAAETRRVLDAEIMINARLEAADQPADVQDELVDINTDARPRALQVALLVPIAAGRDRPAQRLPDGPAA